MADRHVVIVGAGPAGLLLAVYLLKRPGYRVSVFEQRADPRLTPQVQNRTFPISLQERGQQALRSISGLEQAVADRSTVCNGTIMHQASGKSRAIPRKMSSLMIDRLQMVMVLLQFLSDQYSSDQLVIQFNCRCTHLNSAAQTLQFEQPDGEVITHTYDVVVGADGARSKLREALVEQVNFPCEQTLIPDAYKSVFLTQPEDGAPLAVDKVHTLNLPNNVRMMLVPQGNTQLNGVLVFKRDHSPIAQYNTKEEILAFVQENFPRFGALMTLDEADALLSRPVANVTTVRCQRFHEGSNILLIGDAVHAVSASIGQGCNSALQDVWVFNQLLDQHQDNWSQTLPAFSDQRIPEVHALRELSDYSFPRNKLLVTEFILRLQLGRILNRWFPKRFPPFLFDLIFDSDLPYSEVLKIHQGWINKVKASTR
ncbi:FAD-dependent oxidoreductase [Acaryochloris marina]|uniref:Kynurenine 3-monooxygenase, putative n=1 Tax=Acaryochloris marina (strain MBIC 11017) TaxID=329726 RepID=B0C320_ACAM1|nr:NAD(P)/FAD-dependent oxidoreductase [Acaryochloris marina]ABW27367.1 kynurenine 3-monooxygenase, putative [Acaryochloris marina MBIC11017]BDM82108.1 oxidoreductase [Acaryochloris marina MBIC10699]